MIVFKLERERPAFSLSGDSLFYATDRSLRCYEFSALRDTQVFLPGAASLNKNPTTLSTLSYKPTENAVLICSDLDGGSYKLYIIWKATGSSQYQVLNSMSGRGDSAVFIAGNQFAVLEKSTNQVLVKNLKNVVVGKGTLTLPIATDAIFFAGTGNVRCLLCRSEDEVVIFDLQKRLVLGKLQTPFVRYVVWSNDMESVALLSKNTIIIASKMLVHQCTLHETIRVKSGAWDDIGVFIYTTPNHIKFCLPNGDSGIIKTLEDPIYITKVTANIISCLDRDGKNRSITIDATEYIFKLSLPRKNKDHVMSMLVNSQLCGQAMVTYLLQKGFLEIAFHLVEDERIRFNMALQCGNINVAAALAPEINENDKWNKLGVEALRHGNVGLAEHAYEKAKNFERLSFLHVITGKREKLMKIAEVKNNVMGQFQNALYLGDVKERVKILENAGHLPLAYITASIHGLNDITERLAGELGGNVPSLPEGKTPSLLMPPFPIMCGGDWPLQEVADGGAAGVAEGEEEGEVAEGGAAGVAEGEEEGVAEDARLDFIGNGGH